MRDRTLVRRWIPVGLAAMVAALPSFALDRPPGFHAGNGPGPAAQILPPPPEFPERPPGNIDATPAAIEKAVGELGHADTAVGDAATARLFWIGEPARAALKEAAGSEDPEVRTRAGNVLKLIDAAAALQEVNVKFLVRGYCRAGAAAEDPAALGGFARSDNAPREVTAAMKVREGELHLLAEPDRLMTFGKTHRGMRLLLINATGQEVWLGASDSRLNIVQEAKNDKGEWQAIEYLPQSW